jgi:hypothetical protein
MTEVEWIASEFPQDMLDFLDGRVSDRKLRLFVCACCRLLNNLPLYQDIGWLIDTAERYADGSASAAELEECRDSLHRYHEKLTLSSLAWLALDVPEDPDHGFQKQAEEAGDKATGCVVQGLWKKCEREGYFPDGTMEEAVYTLPGLVKAAECAFLRCIAGNPFRPAAVDPRWRTRLVVQLAEAAWEEYIPEGLPVLSLLRSGGTSLGGAPPWQGLTGLPILADALEDAGCTDTDILDHCRGEGPHVRGCWVMDLILGKE